MNAAQCRAARGLVGWSQTDLAIAAKVSKRTIASFEVGQREPYPDNLASLQSALEGAGVQFVQAGDTSGGVGVVLKGQ